MNGAVKVLTGTDRLSLGLFGLGAMLVLFAVGYDQGQIVGLSTADMSQLMVVHEFFHDARHAAGLACH
jgi:hypothetical protein